MFLGCQYFWTKLGQFLWFHQYGVLPGDRAFEDFLKFYSNSISIFYFLTIWKSKSNLTPWQVLSSYGSLENSGNPKYRILIFKPHWVSRLAGNKKTFFKTMPVTAQYRHNLRLYIYPLPCDDLSFLLKFENLFLFQKINKIISVLSERLKTDMQFTTFWSTVFRFEQV